MAPPNYYDELVQRIEALEAGLSLDQLPLAQLRRALIENGDPLDLSVLALGGFPGAKLHIATATTSGPTRANNDYTTGTPVLQEMTLTRDFGTSLILVLFAGTFTHTVAGTAITAAIFHNGVQRVNSEMSEGAAAAGEQLVLIDAFTPGAGLKTTEVRWRSVATATAVSTRRVMAILEVPQP